jgi:hypothetical protein
MFRIAISTSKFLFWDLCHYKTIDATVLFCAASYNWFFIEYWIKTGLDFYPKPFFYLGMFATI